MILIRDHATKPVTITLTQLHRYMLESHSLSSKTRSVSIHFPQNWEQNPIPVQTQKKNKEEIR